VEAAGGSGRQGYRRFQLRLLRWQRSGLPRIARQYAAPPGAFRLSNNPAQLERTAPTVTNSR
jgi:hypothetical protein